MSGVTVAVAVLEDSGGLGGIGDDMWNSITNDMIAFDDDMASTTMDDSTINDMIAVDAVTSTIITTTTTTTTTTTNIALDDNTNYERSLLSGLDCLSLSIENKELECENTECCTWTSFVTTSVGRCSDSEDDGCPIYFCGIYFAESDCENAEECCTWSSSLSMCSGSYGDSCSPFLDDIFTTDDTKVNDFTSYPTYDEMTLTPTSDWRPSSINDGDDDDGDDTRNKIILGSVIGGVCLIVIVGVLAKMATTKKKRDDVHTPSDQFLNTTAYGGLDFTPPTSNGPTSIPTTRFDFEAGVAARADAVASFNNHTSMTHEPTTTTTTSDATTVTKDKNQLKEGKVKGTTTTAATTKGIATTGPAAVATTAVVMAEAVPSSSLPSSSSTNVHGTETVAVAVAVAIAVPVAVPGTEITK